MMQPVDHGGPVLCPTLAALVDRSPTAVLVVGSDGRIRYGNDASLELFGLTTDELLEMSYDDLIIGHAPHPGREPSRFHSHAEPTSALPLPVNARHRSGAELEVTIETIELADEGLTGIIVRDTVALHRTVRRLSATVELLSTALSQPDPVSIEARAAELGRHVLDADICLIRHRDGRVAHRASDRPYRPRISTELIDRFSDMVRDLRADRVVRVDQNHDAAATSDLPNGDAAMNEVVVAPIGRNGTTFGHLAAVRLTGSHPFPSHTEHTTTEYAHAVALAFDLWNTRDEIDRLHWMVDHDRIARDLHDTVIQRLFATAMRLDATIPVTDQPAAGRIHEASLEIDDVIRDIRTTIFNLRRPATSRGGLRAAIAAEVDGFAGAVGFVPRLRFDGVIDGSALPDRLADSVVVVTRELLANVAKHARATAVEVSVNVEDDSLILTVADDGIGLSTVPGDGDGLSNLTQRATELGGRFEIGNHANGTRASWTVPIADRSDRVTP